MTNQKTQLVKFPETISYQHTQYSKVLFLLLGLPFTVCLLAALTIPSQQYTLLSISAAIGIVAGLFSSLTIRVGDRFLHWRFGPGVVSKKIALAQIKHFEITRTTWLEGWGIHYTSRGWLYSVSGFDALLITLKDGKRLMLGSNDVVKLHAALSAWSSNQTS